MTIKVTNNHTATLGVAGVSIEAGKSVGVEEKALRNCLSSNAIKTWIKLELIEIEGLDDLTDESEKTPSVKIPGLNTGEKSEERKALEAKAIELSVQGDVTKMKDETLTKKIADATA